ncbi:MAG: PqqD family protein [Calditrichales bacterium]|nr:MAG: PqqD family protein [Calditrichales bacterium]
MPDTPERNLLTLVPIRRMEWKTDPESGLIRIIKPKFIHPLMVKYILPRLKKPYYEIKLDAFGSFVWNSIDGHLTVDGIAGKMRETFGDAIEPVYDRLGEFITNLDRYKFIGFK